METELKRVDRTRNTTKAAGLGSRIKTGGAIQDVKLFVLKWPESCNVDAVRRGGSEGAGFSRTLA